MRRRRGRLPRPLTPSGPAGLARSGAGRSKTDKPDATRSRGEEAWRFPVGSFLRFLPWTSGREPPGSNGGRSALLPRGRSIENTFATRATANCQQTQPFDAQIEATLGFDHAPPLDHASRRRWLSAAVGPPGAHGHQRQRAPLAGDRPRKEGGRRGPGGARAHDRHRGLRAAVRAAGMAGRLDRRPVSEAVGHRLVQVRGGLHRGRRGSCRGLGRAVGRNVRRPPGRPLAAAGDRDRDRLSGGAARAERDRHDSRDGAHAQALSCQWALRHGDAGRHARGDGRG